MMRIREDPQVFIIKLMKHQSMRKWWGFMMMS